MLFAKSRLIKYFIIIYLCTFLTGVPFVASSIAKITIKDPSKPLEVITIKKGDTLWDLAQKYLNAPLKWREFENNNIYTNPHLIYPGEEMQIPLPAAKEMLEGMKGAVQVDVALSDELKKMSEETSAKLRELEEAIALLKSNSATKADLEKVLRQIENLQGQLGASRQATISPLDFQQTVGKITEKIEENGENVTSIDRRINGLEGTLKQGEESLQQTQDKLSELDKNIQALQSGIDKNQESIAKLESLLRKAEGDVEIEPEKKNKRVFAFITAALGAGAWFVVNSLSHLD